MTVFLLSFKGLIKYTILIVIVEKTHFKYT